MNNKKFTLRTKRKGSESTKNIGYVKSKANRNYLKANSQTKKTSKEKENHHEINMRFLPPIAGEAEAYEDYVKNFGENKPKGHQSSIMDKDGRNKQGLETHDHLNIPNLTRDGDNDIVSSENETKGKHHHSYMGGYTIKPKIMNKNKSNIIRQSLI